MEKLLSFSMLVAVISAVAVTGPTPRMTTTESQWSNLDGRMVTISQLEGGVSFFAPDDLGVSAATATSTGTGMSVCLRYVVDYMQKLSKPEIFTLDSSSGDFLGLRIEGTDQYRMSISGNFTSYLVYLTTDTFLWPAVAGSLWTRICLTLDFRKNVVQMFSGRKISIRKMLPRSYVLSGKPVIQFSGFDGQVTDVQMWDYPLCYQQVLAYMNFPRFRPAGSILTWSHISYSGGGNVLVEDTYENLAKLPFKGKLGKQRERMFSRMVQPKKTTNRWF